MTTLVHTGTRTPRVDLSLLKGRRLWLGLEETLGLVLALVVALPALLLPILSPGIPAPVWVMLLIFDLALLIVPLRARPLWIAQGGTLVAILLVSTLAVVESQIYAQTPPILDAQGNVLPHSIATLEKVNLNGADEWITIRGKNVNNPILLNLGMGGPGGGGFATRSMFEPLEDHFVVVSWDEPGTGKAYNAVPISSLTPSRFVEDAHALTQFLRARFHQDKIYVYGVSWTSIVGIWLVQKYPDLFYAYIGNGQMVNTTENDVMGYQFAVNNAAERGDNATVATLRQNGPPPYVGDGMVWKYVAYLDVLNDYMGELHYGVSVPIVPFLASEYGMVDKINHTRGLVESFTAIYPQLHDLDFTTQANKLDVPVYFLVGRNDVNAMASLVEKYYSVLNAPHKELIWFGSGHGANEESMKQMVDVMVNKVLVDTQPAK